MYSIYMCYYVHVYTCICTLYNVRVYSAYYMDPKRLRMHEPLRVVSTHDHTYAASFQVYSKRVFFLICVLLSFFHAMYMYTYTCTFSWPTVTHSSDGGLPVISSWRMCHVCSHEDHWSLEHCRSGGREGGTVCAHALRFTLCI